jgi:hypothetical protein
MCLLPVVRGSEFDFFVAQHGEQARADQFPHQHRLASLSFSGSKALEICGAFVP